MASQKVCYLSTGIMDTAFDSQVLPLLERLHKSGFDLIHFSFNPFNSKKKRGYYQKNDEIESTGINTLSFRQTPPISRIFLNYDTKRIIHAFTRWRGGQEKKVVIHCRGHLNAYRGLLLKRLDPTLIHVISDLRGAASDEVHEGSNGFVRNLFVQYLSKLYRGIESQIVRETDAILCVSNVFKEFLQTDYGVKNIRVIPTFVDTSRFKFSQFLRNEYRRKLGISNQTVLVYSGGIAPWQKIGSVIRFFIQLSQKVDNLFMLFLTHEPNLVKAMIKDQIKPEDIKVVQVPHGEVAGYLCAADIGILLREKNFTNHVASPIKFSEYMCCGLPCIISSHIGDTGEILRDGNAGIILKSYLDIPSPAELQKLLPLNRNEISNFMVNKFSSEVFIPNILDIYKDIAGGQEMN